MILPDYNGNSIVNLMSSILKATNAESHYNPLKNLDIQKLSERENIVLIVLDGLGYKYLTEKGQDSVFYKHLKSRMTSVFPSTTASAITTFASGVATMEHAITGWFMYFRELGTASVVLPFTPRFNNRSFGKSKINPTEIFDFPSIFDSIQRDSYVITKKFIKNSEFNQYSLKNAKCKGYNSLKGFIHLISKVIKSGKNKKYIYAYWPDFDKISHHFGVKSDKTMNHFQVLNQAIIKLMKKLKGTDTILIITADHGLIDSEPEKMLNMKDHPILKDTLSLPLCGEPRVPYCYVKPSKVATFENYIKNELFYACELFTSEEMINKSFFGTAYENPKLKDRIGDYILLMKENYVFHEWVLGERPFSFIGYHGNTTEDEMYVPLIIIDDKEESNSNAAF